jgi:hypothetical protein
MCGRHREQRAHTGAVVVGEAELFAGALQSVCKFGAVEIDEHRRIVPSDAHANVARATQLPRHDLMKTSEAGLRPASVIELVTTGLIQRLRGIERLRAFGPRAACLTRALLRSAALSAAALQRFGHLVDQRTR